MQRNFYYDCITIKDIEDNNHIIFICDGDKQKVILEKESD